MQATSPTGKNLINRTRLAAEAFVKAVNAQGGIVLEDYWLGAREPHRIKCSQGHEVDVYPELIHRGCGICKVCSGKDSGTVRQRFMDAVAAHGGTVLASTWLTARDRMPVRCPEGHENMVLPAGVFQGSGICRTCARLDPVAAKTSFRTLANKHGITVLSVAWAGVKANHQFRCPAGHRFSATPNNLRRALKGGSNGCRWCAGNYRGKGAEAFSAALAELGATLLEPTWKGAGQPHHAKCAAGHNCWPRPNHVKRGRGICITCAGQDTAVAEAEFRKRLADLGMTLLEPRYLGANTPHRAVCAEGHACRPWPTSLQQGGGACSACANRAWDVFYVVTNQTLNRVKFGISSGDGKMRLTKHRRDGYLQVELLLTGLPGRAASDLEGAVKATLRLAGDVPVHGLEYFDISALAVILDVSTRVEGNPQNIA